MTSYRPMTDVWILARSKRKNTDGYYGCYPEGFLWRALAALGDPRRCLHVCSGKTQRVPKHIYVDIDRNLDVDICGNGLTLPFRDNTFPAVILDPPYSVEDSKHYEHTNYPNPRKLFAEALRVVKVTGRVGFLHYIIPSAPPGKADNIKWLGYYPVVMGFNNSVRIFSVCRKEK